MCVECRHVLHSVLDIIHERWKYIDLCSFRPASTFFFLFILFLIISLYSLYTCVYKKGNFVTLKPHKAWREHEECRKVLYGDYVTCVIFLVWLAHESQSVDWILLSLSSLCGTHPTPTSQNWIFSSPSFLNMFQFVVGSCLCRKCLFLFFLHKNYKPHRKHLNMHTWKYFLIDVAW